MVGESHSQHILQTPTDYARLHRILHNVFFPPKIQLKTAILPGEDNMVFIKGVEDIMQYNI